MPQFPLTYEHRVFGAWLFLTIIFGLWFWSELRPRWNWASDDYRMKGLRCIRTLLFMAMCILIAMLLSGCAGPSTRDARDLDQFVRYVEKHR